MCTHHTTGNKMAPQHKRSTSINISFHIVYWDWPSSVSSIIICAMFAKIYGKSQRYISERPQKQLWRQDVNFFCRTNQSKLIKTQIRFGEAPMLQNSGRKKKVNAQIYGDYMSNHAICQHVLISRVVTQRKGSTALTN